jgi:hypothetical protein
MSTPPDLVDTATLYRLTELGRSLEEPLAALEQVLVEYLAHHNHHRPHRSLDQRAPQQMGVAPNSIKDPDPTHLRRTEILDGLIHEYRLVV